MSDKDIKSIALFFYFALLDDVKAIEAANKAMSILKEKKKRNPNTRTEVLVVSATHAIWESIHKKIYRGRPNTTGESGWIIPQELDLGPWREFQKNASTDELLVVIWTKILNYSDDIVSEGLGLSTGTVRYRCARAFRKLGGMTNMTPKTV